MAYTYADAIKKIKDAGLFDETSEYDKALLVSNPAFADSIIRNKTGYKNAGSEEEQRKYNDHLNADRAYLGGYTGGFGGTEYNPTGNAGQGGTLSAGTKNEGAKTGEKSVSGAPSSFSENSLGAYQSPYGAQLSKYMTPASSGKFSYNYKSDPTYQALYAAALKNGEIAGKNTLARAAAMTGGAPSTYAVMASAAAENQALNDVAYKIPELEAAAYQRYADMRNFNENQRQNMLNTYMNLDNTAYGRYRDELGDRRYEDETAYGREQSEKQWNYNVEQDERERALQEAALEASLTGDYTKYAELLGVPVESINIYQAKLQAEKAKSSGGGSSGGGSSGGSSYSRKGITAAAGTKEWYRQMNDAYGDDAYHIFANSYSSFGVKNQSRAQDILDGWINTNVSSIKNEHGDTWVYVPGYGRVSYSELETLVDSGKVKEKISSNGEAQYISINPGEK